MTKSSFIHPSATAKDRHAMDTRKVQVIFLGYCTFFLVLHLAKAKPCGPYEGNGMCRFNLALRNKCVYVMSIYKATWRHEKQIYQMLDSLTPFFQGYIFISKNEIVFLTVFNQNICAFPR